MKREVNLFKLPNFLKDKSNQKVKNLKQIKKWILLLSQK